jgi:pyruvate/2-oxoglutarate/acetoin dehydrogenase E1 component
VAVRTLVQAVNDGLRQEMARDESVMVLCEDVATLGGVFRATDGLLEEFGPDRCVDTPLAEAGIVGTAIGLALAGWRPVCEMQYEAFSYPALDQVLSHVSRYRWRSGGAIEMPMVIRMPYGGGVRAPELHEDSPEAYYAHAPGIKLAIPSTPADAKGLIAAAVRDPDPVVVLEPKALYRSSADAVPDGEHFVELGRALVARHGTDATLIAYGAMLPVASAAAERLAEAGEAEVEVLDLRTLTPLDEDAILDSVAKTGRAVIVHEAPRTAGFGAEVAALIAERGILDLRAPVRRVTGYDVPYPYWSLEDRYIPDADRVVRALEEVLGF